jgi:anaerobic dimethyl sulfoxide reductase subunit A
MRNATIYEAPRPEAGPGETVVTSTCGHNCGGRCVVNAHVIDGRITKISTDSRRWNPQLPPLAACARGLGQVERVNHPDRLQCPMRRTGPRGSGQYERISWDEALDQVAAELLRVRATYGNTAILDASRSGSLSMLHGRAAASRFFNMFGGNTTLWSNMSCEAEIFAVRMTFGANATNKTAGREMTDYVNSKLIVMWGWSPADGTFGTNTPQYLRHARQQGTRIIAVDPRRHRSSASLADEHIFIRPSTDTAALIAMAQVIVAEGLHDQAYLDRHVLGFDEAHLPAGAPAGSSYVAYLMGEADGVIKNPEWAAPLCGIPAETIRRLAIEFATTKPAALHCGYAPGRTINGEQFHRAAYALAAITGNIGISGGNSGVSNGATGSGGIEPLPAGSNPLGASARVSSPLLADLLARGRAGGYPADIKLIYSAGGDLFNQAPNAGRIARSLDSVEFIVVQDHFLTPTARHADIVLPATTFWERNDIHTPWAGAGHYAIYMRQAIAPMYECRNDMDIFADLARRVGIDGYIDDDEETALRKIAAPAVDDFEAFREKGVARFAEPEEQVAFARQIRDPDNHRFSTPSGKIEIYSTAMAANPDPYGLGAMPPIPTWIAPPASDYPLLLCSPKSRARTHSIHGNQEKLGRVDPDDVWLHPDDAAARGIADGQRVRVFNEHGAVFLPARVTDRIAPGVVSIKEGAWFSPDATGTDTAGCANAVTADRTAPCGATTYNTNNVEVAPA